MEQFRGNTLHLSGNEAKRFFELAKHPDLEILRKRDMFLDSIKKELKTEKIGNVKFIDVSDLDIPTMYNISYNVKLTTSLFNNLFKYVPIICKKTTYSSFAHNEKYDFYYNSFFYEINGISEQMPKTTSQKVVIDYTCSKKPVLCMNNLESLSPSA